MKKLLALLAVATLGAAACASGTNGGRASDDEAIEITMVDSRFQPTELTVDKDRDLTFAFTNEGAVPHDAFIGDKDAQKDHDHEMRMQDDEGEIGGHGEHGAQGDGITLQPGERGTLEHRFTRAGTYYIGCHQEGHWDAGMRVELTVRPRST